MAKAALNLQESALSNTNSCIKARSWSIMDENKVVNKKHFVVINKIYAGL